MNPEQQNTCIALLLAIAFNSSDPTAMGIIPSIAKKLLATLPPEEVAKAAGTPIDFNKYFEVKNDS